MRFSTIQNYIEAVSDLELRCRGNCNFVPLLDNNKNVIYKVGKGVVGFALEGNLSLYMFTNEDGYKRFCEKNPKVDILAGRLYVSVDQNDGYWADIAVCSRCEDVLKKDNDKSEVYCEGLRSVCKDGKWGFVDQVGNLAVDYHWDEVEDFSESRSLVKLNDLYGLIDSQGRVVVKPEYDDLSWDGSNYLYGEKSGLWGILNRGGEVVVDFAWDWVGEFNYGYAIISKNEKSGFVNTKGEVVIDVKYDEVTSFNEHKVASVILDEKQFFIDTLDRKV